MSLTFHDSPKAKTGRANMGDKFTRNVTEWISHVICVRFCSGFFWFYRTCTKASQSHACRVW